MDDATLIRKLAEIARLANELDAEAKRRYGRNGMLFFEADGQFHLMAGDCAGPGHERTKFIRASSPPCRMGAGAW